MRRADSSGADHPVPARSRVQRFAPAMVAVMAIGAAVVVRLALEPILQGTQAWLTFWPAVFAAAWFGGWRAGIASIVATLSILMVWGTPRTSLTTPGAIAGGFVFALCGSAFSYLAHAVRRVHDLERRLRRGYLRFATALSNASTPEHVARALVEEGAQALSADVSVFAHVIDHERLEG